MGRRPQTKMIGEEVSTSIATLMFLYNRLVCTVVKLAYDDRVIKY